MANPRSGKETVETTVETKKVNPAIIAICNESLNRLSGVPKLPGQRDAIGRAERIIEAIKKGSTFEQISAIFREGPTPMSFSGGGSWLPRELHIAAGRIIEDGVLIVKTTSSKTAYKQYADLAEEILAGRNHEGVTPYVGAYVRCWECGQTILVKEAAHQGICKDCDAKRPNRKGTSGPSITKMSKEMQNLYSFSKAALRHKNGSMADAMLAGLNTAREACGLTPIGMDDFRNVNDAAELMK